MTHVTGMGLAERGNTIRPVEQQLGETRSERLHPVNSATSKNLHFAMSGAEQLKQAIVTLSGVYHVVPSAAPDADLLLSVEIDTEYPDLASEVRRLVGECDPAATELHQ